MPAWKARRISRSSTSMTAAPMPRRSSWRRRSSAFPDCASSAIASRAARARRWPRRCAPRATPGSPRSTATGRTTRPTSRRCWPRVSPGQRAPGLALVAGWRAKRNDSALRKLSSRIANGVRGGLLGDRTPDTGCGLKVFSRELFLRLPFFDHLHRFLPALFLREGAQVISVPVNHRAAHARPLQVRRAQPPVGRHRRPVRRDVAEPAHDPSGDRRMNIHSISIPEWLVLAVGFAGQACSRHAS